ncbi:nephrin-like [Phymastichus coffea]|uniref:nephrin-like n=1 Tax=Phymastichus coffea TaxID=108790 RepID=UPI00273B2DB4|nr:nephrin-like [Phymastichus coffea]
MGLPPLLLTLLLIGLGCSSVEARITNQEIVTMSDAQAVAGNIAQLPCDVEPPTSGDKVHLVIWYKEPADLPIYSFDSRGITALEQGKHWQDPSLGGRAFFKHNDTPAKLNLESVKESDAGLYRCRVDFKQSPTRNSKVNLTVIIPPEQLSILDEGGESHITYYRLGPYSEGASLNITCVAAGGRPQPRVTWWQENALLDDSYEVIGNKKVRNVLRLEKLERKHLHAVLTCQASNNNMVAPISSSVTLDMNLRPLWVRLQGENRPLSAGMTYEIGCEVVGAKPEPTIEWTKGGVALKNVRQTVSPDGNTTTSVVTFVPSIEDAGKFLSCRARVAEIPDSEMEADWKLDIHHSPVITLELGSNLNASAIREGLDVYFECNIKSNPWVYKVSWKHNGTPLYNNVASGTIVSNQSLVLQNVSRNRAGIYTCVGSNQEGDGESNQLSLDIKFAPVCRAGQTKVFGVARQETVKIPCELEANPRDVTFSWKFNNTMETMDIPLELISSDQAHSSVSYTPMNELDYGTLLCAGTNELGAQAEPCLFHVVPAGRPDTPHNCSLQNTTSDTLRVECAESFDGGLRQKFTLVVELESSPVAAAAPPSASPGVVLRTPAGAVVYNLTSNQPDFRISGLEPSTSYLLTVYSSNSKGRSEPVQLHATTLNQPERRTGDKPLRPPSPENCTITEETRTTVRVSCAESDYVDSKSAMYVLQVFDAETRRLLASATSMSPSMLEVTDLPAERSHSGLVLFVRVMTAHATSDATVLNSQQNLNSGESPEHQIFPALSPVILSLSGPLLGVVVGVAAGLVIVIFLIIVALKLRYRQRSQDDKDSQHDDGGMATLTAPNDKTASLPLSSDSIESFEKDPDIIPQATDNSYAELCKGTSPRYVLQQQSHPSSHLLEPGSLGSLNNASKMQYADLTLRINRRVPPNCYQPVPRSQLLPMSTLPRRLPSSCAASAANDPTIYAQLAAASAAASVAATAAASAHSAKPIYIPPPHQYMSSSSRSPDETTAETPLIGSDNKITTITEAANSWRGAEAPGASSNNVNSNSTVST